MVVVMPGHYIAVVLAGPEEKCPASTAAAPVHTAADFICCVGVRNS